jgi:hypothetical protein
MNSTMKMELYDKATAREGEREGERERERERERESMVAKWQSDLPSLELFA